MTYEVASSLYDISVDEQTAWACSTRDLGNTYPGITDDANQNIEHLLQAVQPFSAAREVIRMTAVGGPADYFDLDRVDEAQEAYSTEALITTNPNYMLRAHPADCGEIAVSGFGTLVEKPVIALIHANRRNLPRGTSLKALQYMSETYGLLPDDMNVRLAPSARKETYKFPEVDDEQRTHPAWQKYVYQDDEGMWHVDFHGRTVDELVAFGIRPKNMRIHPGDTTSPDMKYFSWTHVRQGKYADGNNAVLFSLRSDT